MRRRYAMVNRPAGFGAVPSGLGYSVEPRPPFGHAHHEMARHGILLPERALAASEMVSFEIAQIVEDEELPSHAAAVVHRRMGAYASEYLQSAQDDLEVFTRGVLELACRGENGVRFSIGDGNRLVEEVLARLREACERQGT